MKASSLPSTTTVGVMNIWFRMPFPSLHRRVASRSPRLLPTPRRHFADASIFAFSVLPVCRKNHAGIIFPETSFRAVFPLFKPSFRRRR
jgi:hypothetical protein